MASGMTLATRPAPTMSKRLASARASIEAARAEAAAVRLVVISPPSICASGTPVLASNKV